jgi:hypothetical protein
MVSNDRNQQVKQYGKIVARAWTDDAFRQRLLADPKGVLAEFGIPSNANREIRVVENSEDVFYLVLPQKPGNLSADQIDGDIAPDCVVTECDTCATEANVDK